MTLVSGSLADRAHGLKKVFPLVAHIGADANVDLMGDGACHGAVWERPR